MEFCYSYNQRAEHKTSLSSIVQTISIISPSQLSIFTRHLISISRRQVSLPPSNTLLINNKSNKHDIDKLIASKWQTNEYFSINVSPIIRVHNNNNSNAKMVKRLTEVTTRQNYYQCRCINSSNVAIMVNCTFVAHSTATELSVVWWDSLQGCMPHSNFAHAKRLSTQVQWQRNNNNNVECTKCIIDGYIDGRALPDDRL